MENYFNENTLERLIRTRKENVWMKKKRFEALSKFTELPWPSSFDEEWRRTKISHIDFESYNICFDRNKNGHVDLVQNLNGISGKLRFIGSANVEATLVDDLNLKKVIFSSLGSALNKYPEMIQQYFMNKNHQTNHGKFQTLHESFWSHGVFLYVPAFTEIELPFLAVMEETGDKSASFPNILVVLEKGARATLNINIRSTNDDEIFRNAVVNLHLKDGAVLNYGEVQNLNKKSLNFSNGWASIGRDAGLNSFVANFGSNMTKSNFGTALKGHGAVANLKGIYFAEHNQHFDQRTIQYHESPNAVSNLLYKGVVRDRAHAIYQGLIKVFPDAQGTDAYQSNKNLILNDGARADSIPSLEIEANDVKCSHGSTVGRVNDEELFYLMSRGLPENEAKKMIVQGFLDDVVAEIPHNIRANFQHVLDKELEAI